MCQKSGEISLLKQQLKEIQSELSQKGGELVVLKSQLREARTDLQNSQARSQEAGSALRTRSLELEVCENELQRRKSEAELLREKVGCLEEELARLRDALANQGGGYLPGGQAPATKGQCMSLPLPQGRGGVAGGRGGLSPSVGYREAEEGRLGWGGESDETKAQRQSAEAVLGLRQQVSSNNNDVYTFFQSHMNPHPSHHCTSFCGFSIGVQTVKPAHVKTTHLEKQ